MLCLLALAAPVCASREPDGPLFEPAPAPGPGQSLLYLYRGDEDRASGTLRLRLDGEDLAALHDGEFAALFIAPGEHQLDAALRVLPFVASSWTRTRFCVDEVGIAYVRVWARLVAEETTESRQREVATPGWPGERPQLVVLAGSESARNALAHLESRREASWSPAVLRPKTASPPGAFGSRCGREPR